MAGKLGLKAVTVQEGWVDYNDLAYDKVGNIQLTRIMGGDPRVDPSGFDIGFRDSWQRVIGIDASATLDQTIDQVTRIAGRTADAIGSAVPCGTTRSWSSPVTRARPTAYPSPDRRGDPPGGPDRGHAHRSGVRRRVATGRRVRVAGRVVN